MPLTGQSFTSQNVGLGKAEPNPQDEYRPPKRSRALLGHTSLSTTTPYAAVGAERLCAVYDKAHPRANLA